MNRLPSARLLHRVQTLQDFVLKLREAAALQAFAPRFAQPAPFYGVALGAAVLPQSPRAVNRA
jgi:hypothetical protein